MPTVEMQYPSLLNGVSQQTPRERINGQLTEQINMKSDPVTGLRRRPCFEYRSGINFSGSYDWHHIYSQYLELGSTPVNLFINTKDGEVVITDDKFRILKTYTEKYLIASDATKIRATNSSGLGWILNVDKKPVPVPSTERDPSNLGYLTIKTGAFLKDYRFRINNTEVSYTTPSGSESGDAAKSTPDGVAKELIGKVQSSVPGITVYNEGATLYFEHNSKLEVVNLCGGNYASASGSGVIRNISELPASLPAKANGYIVTVGQSESAREYYKWNKETSSWDECGEWQSYKGFDDMPMQLSIDEGGTPELKAIRFEGRLSGDDENNPYPSFVYDGITGIGTFMGRLVLLSGSRVLLSASRYPIRTMRSTVTSVLDTDPIEVASGSTSSASFEHAVQFNKDLILFASTHQAVIPTGNNALTPTNAMLVITAEQSVDCTARPAVVGQTLMYSATTSDTYFGIGELTPSSYTGSQYTPQNLTDHLPKYFEGKCRQLVSGGSNNIMLFTSSVDPKVIYVHEFFWSGNERQFMSWHKWTAPDSICSIHYAKSNIVITLAGNNKALTVCTIDPNTSSYLGNTNKPIMDFATKGYKRLSEDGTTYYEVDEYMSDLISKGNAICTSTTLGLETEVVGIDGLYTDPVAHKYGVILNSSYRRDDVNVGIKFTSTVIPNAPIVMSTSYSGAKTLVSTTKDTCNSARVTVQNTGNFTIQVRDGRTPPEYEGSTDRTPLVWSSRELDLGKAKTSGVGDILIPCRTNAHTTQIEFSTDNAKELNLLSLVYVMRLHQNRNRRKM